MARKIIVTLIRNDLRTHDHAVFHAVHQPINSDVTHMLPLYVFDERSLELSGLPGYIRQGPEARTRLCKFWRSGVFRTRFLTEGVYNLRDNLQKLNSNLLIRFGKTEEVAFNIVEALRANGDEVKGVYLQTEHTSEEINVERKLEASLRKIRVPLISFDTKALVHPQDLPFKISQTPDVFTPYRKKVESSGPLGRKTFTMPKQFKPFPNPTPGFKPTGPISYGSQFDKKTVEDLLPYLLNPLKDTYQEKFISSDNPRSEFSAIPFKGGETAALERLNQYFHMGNPPPVAKYKETRNGLLGHEYSTKFSTFLSFGMLSPRLIMESLDEHELKFGESDNTYWVRFELLWRDYFIFIGQKFGTNLFKLGGLEAITDPRESRIKTQPGWWKNWDTSLGPNQVINKWIEGRCGVPFIDANMVELRETGYMGNRGRQNVASFLTKDLGYDWRIGAEVFESLLIDHDPTSNWGNWTYVGGVGNDPRASRQFNPIKQAHDYDPHGSYIKVWLPQLAKLPMNKIQIPWTMVPTDRAQYVNGGEEVYPYSPVVEQSHWKPHYQRGANLKGHNKLNGNPNERVKNPGPRGGAPKVEGGDGGGGGEGRSRGSGGGGGRGGGNRGSSSSRGRGGSNA